MIVTLATVVGCNAYTGANWIRWPKKSCCTSFWLSWPKECNSTIDNSIGIMWCWVCCQWITYFQHWCQWCQLMLMLVSMASHDQRCHVAPHFDCLNPRNTVVTLMMLSTTHDTNDSGNGITWTKNYAAPYSNHLHIKTAKMSLTFLLGSMASHDQKSCCTSFWSPDLRNAMVPLMILSTSHDVNADADLCEVTDQKIILHINLIILTYGMQCWNFLCNWYHAKPTPAHMAFHD